MGTFDTSYDTLLNYDYVNSFVQWTRPDMDHTPRCALHASCKIRGPGEKFREFFLTHPCAAEQMYVERNLIHKPTAEFHAVFCNEGQFMYIKHFEDSPGFERMVFTVGDAVKSQYGKRSKITEMKGYLRHFNHVVEMTSYEEVHDAMVGNKTILGRTRFAALKSDSEMEVVAEYPVTVMNVRHEHDTWQIDTGPILLPDFSIEHDLEVALFRQAYIVYNRWDYAEYAMRLPVTIEGARHPVLHYSSPQHLESGVRNQLFLVH